MSPAQPVQPVQPAQPAQPIHDLLTRLTTAWNDGDATAYADLFTEDADYITFFGLHMTDRAAIESSHRALFEGPLQGSKLEGKGEAPRIRFLGPDVAVAVVTGHAPTDQSQSSIITMTAVRDDDRWRFASFQNTRITSPPGRPQ